jgi:adenylate cyclase class IV
MTGPASVPGVNLELKVRLEDPKAAETALAALGARFAGVLHQRDTYRRVTSGRTKLRELDDRAELIEYERSEDGGERWSHYTITPGAEPVTLVARWQAEGVVRGVVDKQRRLWLYQNARIHIDAVRGLGDFLEIEVVDPPSPADGRRVLDELVAALRLDTAKSIAGSYIDLLEAADRAPSAIEEGAHLLQAAQPLGVQVVDEAAG